MSFSLAKQKGYTNTTSYAFLVFFFSGLVLLYVVGLPDTIAQNQRDIIIDRLKDINKQLNKNIIQNDNAKTIEEFTIKSATSYMTKPTPVTESFGIKNPDYPKIIHLWL